jgi:hypothetical protein
LDYADSIHVRALSSDHSLLFTKRTGAAVKTAWGGCWTLRSASPDRGSGFRRDWLSEVEVWMIGHQFNPRSIDIGTKNYFSISAIRRFFGECCTMYSSAKIRKFFCHFFDIGNSKG